MKVFFAKDQRSEGPTALATNALDGTHTPEANAFSIMCWWLGRARTKLTGPKKQLGHQQGGSSPLTLRFSVPGKEKEMGTLQKLRTASKSAALRANGRKSSVWVHCTESQP